MENNEENLVEPRYSTTLLSGETEKQDIEAGICNRHIDIATDISILLFYGIVRD